jgi:hypothetical protein
MSLLKPRGKAAHAAVPTGNGYAETHRHGESPPTVAATPPETARRAPERGAGVTARNGNEPSRGAIPLPSDPRATLVLLNEARRRAIGTVFGVRNDQVNLMTVMAALTLAASVHQTTQHVTRQMRRRRRADVILADGFLNALGQEIAGPFARETPFFAAIIGTATVGAVASRALRESSREMKAASYRLGAWLSDLYRHEVRLIGRGGG